MSLLGNPDKPKRNVGIGDAILKKPTTPREVGIGKAIEREQLDREAGPIGSCSVAQQFQRTLDMEIGKTLGLTPNRASLTKAEYQLQQHWQTQRQTIPIDHFHLGFANSRTYCIDAVYQSNYDKLKALRASLMDFDALRDQPSVDAAVTSSAPPTHPVDAVVLGSDAISEEPIYLDDIDRRKGLYILGLMGMGKSNLLAQMVIQDIEAGRGVCLIDAHGDLVDDILAQCNIPQERLILLDPSDTDWPFGLNLFECEHPELPTSQSPTLNYVVGLFRKLWGDPQLGVQIHDVLRHVAHVFVLSKKYTLVDLPLFLLNDDFRHHVLSNVTLNREHKLFWTQYDKRTDKQVYTQSTLNKVRDFTDDEILWPILGQSQSTINIPQIMEQQKILLIKFPRALLGEGPTTLLGSIIIGQILDAMLHRVSQNRLLRKSFALYCDEFQLFSTPDFIQFFSEGRKFGIQTTVAHQWRSQIDLPLRDATASIANRIAFGVSANDQNEMKRWYNPPENNEPLPITTHPVRYLQRNGHPHEDVTALIEVIDAVMELHKAPPVGSGGGEVGRAINSMIRNSTRNEAETFINALNKYLVFVMANISTFGDSVDIQAFEEMGETIFAATISRVMHQDGAKFKIPDGETEVLFKYETAEESVNYWLKLRPDLENIKQLLYLLALIVSTARQLRISPLREYEFNLQAYADRLPKSGPYADSTKLPIGHAHVRYTAGPEVKETVLKVPKLSDPSPHVVDQRLSDARVHAHGSYTRRRTDVEQEIRERQGVSADADRGASKLVQRRPPKKRLPRYRRVENYPKVQITTPRHKILKAIGRFDYLTASQLARLLFSPASISYVRENLKELYHGKFVQRIFMPGETPYQAEEPAHCLDSAGMRYLRRERIAPQGRFNAEELAQRSNDFLRHTLSANDVLILCHQLARQNTASKLVTFLTERELRRSPGRTYVDGKRTTVITDGWVHLQHQWDNDIYDYYIAFELDRGTIKQMSFRRKIRALLTWINDPNGYITQFSVTQLTLSWVTTHSEKRLEQMIKWTKEELEQRGVSQYEDIFLFKYLDPSAFDPTAFAFAPIWHQMGSEQTVSLLEPPV